MTKHTADSDRQMADPQRKDAMFFSSAVYLEIAVWMPPVHIDSPSVKIGKVN